MEGLCKQNATGIAFCNGLAPLSLNLEKLVIARSKATRQSLEGVRSLLEIATAFGLAMTFYLLGLALD